MAAYMKIPGIKGSATVKGYEDWIVIDTLDLATHRVIQTSPGNTRDRVKTPAYASDMVITKPMDKASPLLFSEACVGKALPEIQLDLCLAGDPLKPYMQYTLTNVLIGEYGVLATVNEKKEQPLEWLSLNFTRLETRYTPYDEKHQASTPLSASHNISSAPHLFFNAADLPPLPDWLVDSIAGFGDGVSFGLTDWIREQLGTNGVVNKHSTSYRAGDIAGVFMPVAAVGRLMRIGYKAGREIKIGNNWRIAPFGNRRNDPLGERPHYHRRGKPGSQKAQGIGRHRPWEVSKENDKSFWDRF